MSYYRPLPDSLTIKKSKIEGLGLFASKDVPKGTNLGVSHRSETSDDYFQDNDYIRTPLGGFVNHSKKPNCEFIWKWYGFDLCTLEDIEEGEELTAIYTLYDPEYL